LDSSFSVSKVIAKRKIVGREKGEEGVELRKIKRVGERGIKKRN
jgi:hypothetical protein